MGIFILRLLVILSLAAAGYFFPIFGLPRPAGAAVAFAAGAIIVYLETLIRRTQFKIIWGSTVGTYAGVFLGWSLGAVYQKIGTDPATALFIRTFFLIILPYISWLISLLRCSGVSCCWASLKAFPGSQCDSIIKPSKSRSIARCETSKRRSRLPQIWLGSVIMGKPGILILSSIGISH